MVTRRDSLDWETWRCQGVFVTPALVLSTTETFKEGRTEPSKHLTVQVTERNAGSTLQPRISKKLPSPTSLFQPHGYLTRKVYAQDLTLLLRGQGGEKGSVVWVLPQAQAGDEEAGGRELWSLAGQ